MKCTVSPSALSTALNLVARAVSPRSTLPVLSNVLLETTDQGLRVTATNLDLTVSVTVEATVETEGRTTVPARLLTDYVASLVEAPCRLELNPATQVLHVVCGIHTSNFHCIDAAEFPPLPARDTEATVEVDSTLLEQAITQTAMAASGDESSPVLTGVLLKMNDSNLTLAATDRHRLAVKTIPFKSGKITDEVIVIIPARHLTEVARAINSTRPTVSIAVSPGRNQVFFSMRDVEISSRLIEGNYPNYVQVIPTETTTTVTVPTSELLRSTKTASILARDAANPVRLQMEQKTLRLLAQTAEVGDHEAPLAADVQGDELQIAFNARYVMDALSVMDTDEVQLSFNGALSPGIMRPKGRDDYLCIIMPVRVPM